MVYLAGFGCAFNLANRGEIAREVTGYLLPAASCPLFLERLPATCLSDALGDDEDAYDIAEIGFH